MLVKELAAIIHQNAVDHGWWDGKRELPELSALIHSEWSEALEEARAGRPLVWYVCNDTKEADAEGCAYKHPNICVTNGPCFYKEHKPEGVAVELIDGCIRILDVLGYVDADMLEPESGEQTDISAIYGDGKHAAAKPDELPEDVPTLIAWLHVFTARAIDGDETQIIPEVNLVAAMSLALSWVQSQGIDPIALLMEKHEYNKGRPYKHGKKF